MNKPELYVSFFSAFWNVASEKHKQYVGTPRPHGQAASFEAVFAFRNAVRGFVKPDQRIKILDAGAGASSCLVRAWFPEDEVITCDPDREYLADVCRTCRVMSDTWKLPELSRGDWLHGFPHVAVDACFFDYGTIERQPTLATALRYTTRIIYVDDVDLRADCAEMRNCVFNSVQKFNKASRDGQWMVRDCQEASDEFSRWGIVLSRT